MTPLSPQFRVRQRGATAIHSATAGATALRAHIERAGGVTAASVQLGTSKGVVWAWLKRGKVSVKRCVQVSGVLQAPLWDLRPGDWWSIWPEMIGRPGAPAVPTEVSNG